MGRSAFATDKSLLVCELQTLQIGMVIVDFVYFARMLFCSIKNVLPYSWAKYCPEKMILRKRAFCQESVLSGEHFAKEYGRSFLERPREHFIKNALLRTFDNAPFAFLRKFLESPQNVFRKSSENP